MNAALLLMLLMLIGLPVGAGLLVAWVVGRGRPAGGDAGDAGTCGSCGYSARGLSSWHCPECGADLRLVGIRPKGKAGRAAPAIAGVLTGSAVLLLLGCVASGLFWASAGSVQRVHPQPQPAQVQRAQPQHLGAKGGSSQGGPATRPAQPRSGGQPGGP